MSFIRGFSFLFATTTLLTGAGCRDVPKRTPAATGDTATRATVTGLSGGTGWDQGLGRVMILPLASDSARAGVVLPGLTDSTLASITKFELTGLDTIGVDLFNQQGLVGQTTLHVLSQRVDPSGCLNWPIGSFLTSPPAAWRIGLESGQAMGLKLNLLATMHGSDSSRFVNDVLGAANSLNNAGDSVFHGLPFSVKSGSRIDGSGVPAIVAEVVRKINEEANPREEHTLLVAEQPTSSSSYGAVFTTRSSGREESLETTDVLAAVQLKSTKQAVIVISMDYEDGGKVGILERFADGTWKLRWKSAYAGC